MIRLDKSTNFELPKVDTVKVVIREQVEPFSYYEVNFDISDNGVISADLADNYLRIGTADLSFVDVIDEIENKLLGVENELLFGNFIFQATVNGVVVEFLLSNTNISDPAYCIKDSNNAVKPTEIPQKIEDKLTWYISLIAAYSSGESDYFFANIDTEFIPTDYVGIAPSEEDSLQYLLSWIEKRTEKVFEKDDYSSDELIDLLSTYVFYQIDLVIDQLRESNKDLNVEIDDDSLDIFITELITRIVSGIGNTLGTDYLSSLAHDYITYFDIHTKNEDGDDNVQLDEYWGEDDNPEKKVLALLSNNSDIYGYFMSVVIEIWNFVASYLEDGNGYDGDSDSPYSPMEI